MQPMPLLRVTRQDRTPQTAPWAREIQIGARLAPPGLTEYMVVEAIVCMGISLASNLNVGVFDI
jgi:hypothetical protein